MYQTILIAEDDADIIELLSLYLSGEGYHILSAENGRQALELMRTEKISLAIVDIMLPEVNGYDLIRKIRETQNFPIIILSAKTMDTDRILGLNLGADAYMTKPFNPLEVVAYVKAALRRYYIVWAGTQAAVCRWRTRVFSPWGNCSWIYINLCCVNVAR